MLPTFSIFFVISREFILLNCIGIPTTLQIVSGRHRQAMYVLHHSIGAVVEFANRWRKSSLFTRGAVKGMQLFGVL